MNTSATSERKATVAKLPAKRKRLYRNPPVAVIQAYFCAGATEIKSENKKSVQQPVYPLRLQKGLIRQVSQINSALKRSKKAATAEDIRAFFSRLERIVK